MRMPSIPAVCADSEKVRAHLQARRHDVSETILALSLAATAFGLVWLAWILWTTLSLGAGGLSMSLSTEMAPVPDTPGGGFINAIAGSLLLVGMTTLISTPLGILAGICLAEYDGTSMLASATRFINDILLSAPSAVISLFVYTVVVVRVQHFSDTADVIALALLQVPIVVRTTENMLNLVPDTMREAVVALGTPKWKMILLIALKASYAGIITDILLAVIRIADETTSLLFAALNNQFRSLDLNQPVAVLPIVIFKFAMGPFPEWRQLAWVRVFPITLSVPGLNAPVRTLFTRK